MSATTRRFRYRVYPDAGQQVALSRAFGCVRVVFNDFITARQEAHAAGLPMPKTSDLAKQVTTLAKATPERAWLAEVSAVALQQSARDADKAYRNFFESMTGKRKGPRVGAPRFKSKRDNRQSIRIPMGKHNFTVRQVARARALLTLPRVPGEIRVRLSRPLPSEPSSVTIICEPDGRYYASFTVQVAERQPLPEVERHAAADVGLTDYVAVVHSDGTRWKEPNPRFFRVGERKLARLQRAHARKEKGSNNRAKARQRVAVQHRKVREQRADHAHKLALGLIRENQTVTVEALNVRGLARSGKKGRAGRGLRKSIHDAAWGQFVRILNEKAPVYGRGVNPEDPAYSSQTCAVCGVLDGPKALHIREWTCKSCGTVLDRDYNAATNLLVAAGHLVETENACGRDVRRTLACADPRPSPSGLGYMQEPPGQAVA